MEVHQAVMYLHETGAEGEKSFDSGRTEIGTGSVFKLVCLFRLIFLLL